MIDRDTFARKLAQRFVLMSVSAAFGILVGFYLNPPQGRGLKGGGDIFVGRVSLDLKLSEKEKEALRIVFEYWEKEKRVVGMKMLEEGPSRFKRQYSAADVRFEERVSEILLQSSNKKKPIKRDVDH